MMLQFGVRHAVFFITFLFSTQVLATSFKSVPDKCEQRLRALNRDSKGEGLVDRVDWSPIIQNLQQMGYPKRIAQDKLREIMWDTATALRSIRDITNDRRWRWGKDFTAANMKALAMDSDILSSLPYWSSLYGFDAAEFVYQYLRRQGSLDEDDVKHLISYAPLWLTGRRAYQNAKMLDDLAHLEAAEFHLILEQLPTQIQTRFLRHITREYSKDFFETSGEDRAMDDLTKISVLPWKSVPVKVKNHLHNAWLELEKYRPIKLDSISLISSGYQAAGNCEMMTNGHINSLGLHLTENCSRKTNGANEHKKSVLIYVGEYLIGSLKLVGDPSMIALRNVIDSDGRLILAMGGVYHIQKDLYDKVKKIKSQNGRWGYIRLSKLKVHPHTFLLNSDAWTSTNATQFLRLIAAEMDKTELLDWAENLIDAASSGYIDSLFSDDEDKKMEVWLAVLDNLDRVRKEME